MGIDPEIIKNAILSIGGISAGLQISQSMSESRAYAENIKKVN